MWKYPEIRTLVDFRSYYARHDPHRAALKSGEREVSCAERERVANRIGHFLLSEGARENALVGFLGKNSVDFYESLFGCAQNRAGFVVLNWRLSAPELMAQIKDSETTLVFVERDMMSLWEDASRLLESSPKALWFDADSPVESLVEGYPDERPEIWVSEDDTAIQLYTSGTTGQPKGVMLSHGGINRMRLWEHFKPSNDWGSAGSFVNPLPSFNSLHLALH